MATKYGTAAVLAVLLRHRAMHPSGGGDAAASSASMSLRGGVRVFGASDLDHLREKVLPRAAVRHPAIARALAECGDDPRLCVELLSQYCTGWEGGYIRRLTGNGARAMALLRYRGAAKGGRG